MVERIIDRQPPCLLEPLRPQSEVVHVDILRGSSGLQKTSLESLEDRSSVVRSLRDYASTMNGDLLNYVIAESFVKPGKTMPAGEFLVRALPKPGRNLGSPKGRGHFWVDGKHGLALGFDKRSRGKPLWLACTSFISYYNLEATPLIRQLQVRTFFGDAHNEPLKEEINLTLQCLRWEHLLVSLVSGWAQSCSLPAIAMISSENFSPLHKVFVSKERAYMRYDVTARRMGFKLQPDKNYLFTFERPTST